MLELQRRRHEVDRQQADAQQQRLAIEMAKLSLVAEQSRGQLAAIEAHGAAEERFLVKAFTLQVTREQEYPDGTHSYAAHLVVTLEGASEKEFEISYSITQAFIGTLTSGSLPAMAAVELNPPPDIFNRIPGPIDWRKVSQTNHVYGPTTYDLGRILRVAQVRSPPSNAGLVASLRKGQITHYETTFLIRAKPANYLGVSVSLGLNGTTTPASNYWYLRRYQVLSSPARATPGATVPGHLTPRSGGAPTPPA